MFKFHCKGHQGLTAKITIHSMHWTQTGETHFSCNGDELALILLTGCKSDSGGHFNLLSGCKPLYLEQWLEYLEETGKIKSFKVEPEAAAPEHIAQQLHLTDENSQLLLQKIYQLGGFNKLQVTRFLKQRGNLTSMSTRYSKEDLDRYLKLGEIINLLRKIRKTG